MSDSFKKLINKKIKNRYYTTAVTINVFLFIVRTSTVNFFPYFKGTKNEQVLYLYIPVLILPNISVAHELFVLPPFTHA
jgi:hypothetical protein